MSTGWPGPRFLRAEASGSPLSSGVCRTFLAAHRTPGLGKRGTTAGVGGTEPLPTQGCFPQPDTTTNFTTWWALALLTTSETLLGMGPECWSKPQAPFKRLTRVLAQPGWGEHANLSAVRRQRRQGGTESLSRSCEPSWESNSAASQKLLLFNGTSPGRWAKTMVSRLEQALAQPRP